MTRSNFIRATDAFDDWRDGVLTGRAPRLFPLGTGDIGRIEVGPGLVTLFGGAPGAGKTAFTMQCIIDALRITPDLRALVANIEMPPSVLLDRQLARLSGISLSDIRHRRIAPEHADRLDQGLNTLAAIADRLCFLRPPFDLGNIASACDEFGAELLALDYIQRFGVAGEHESKRGSVDASMNYLRQFADAGVAVMVVSAVARAKDSKGRSSYSGDGLNLASFRESSELEFGADDAFILAPNESDDDVVDLRHLKSRHGECRDLRLKFDKRRQTFTPAPIAPKAGKARTDAESQRKTRSALAKLWNSTPPAGDDAAEDGGEHE